MANGAGVGNLEGVGVAGSDETKCMASDIHVGNRLFDSRHMTRDTLAAGAVRGMMRVRFDSRRVGTVLRVGAVTG